MGEKVSDPDCQVSDTLDDKKRKRGGETGKSYMGSTLFVFFFSLPLASLRVALNFFVGAFALSASRSRVLQ